MSTYTIPDHILVSTPLALVVEMAARGRESASIHCVEFRPRDGVIDYQSSGTICRYKTLNVSREKCELDTRLIGVPRGWGNG